MNDDTIAKRIGEEVQSLNEMLALEQRVTDRQMKSRPQMRRTAGCASGMGAASPVPEDDGEDDGEH